MKRVVSYLIIVLVMLGLVEVNASNYEMMELIPLDVETTIRGDNFLYKDISYEKGSIKFGSIKNMSDEKKSLTVSIGLFNKKKKNIGIINYCSTEDALDANDFVENFSISITKEYLGEDYSIDDVKYIAILNENINCRLTGADEFLGRRVQEIYKAGNGSLSQNTVILIDMIKVIGCCLLLLFLYKFLFTKAYRNMDGDDVRQEYAYINKQLKKEREEKKKNEVPKPKVVKTHKNEKIIAQEKSEGEKENKDNSNLHNFYK